MDFILKCLEATGAILATVCLILPRYFEEKQLSIRRLITYIILTIVYLVDTVLSFFANDFEFALLLSILWAVVAVSEFNTLKQFQQLDKKNKEEKK